MEIYVRTNPRIVVTDGNGSMRDVQIWSMVVGTGEPDVSDVAGEVIEWARRRMVARPARARRTMKVFEPKSAALQPLREVICEVANAAIERCDPAARSLALMFDPRLRFRVYTRLINDATGRVADLVTSCPGALIFALALIERSRAASAVAAGECLLTSVIAGHRLNPAIDDAIDGWIASIPEYYGKHALRRGRRSNRAEDHDARVLRALQDEDTVQPWRAALALDARDSLRTRQRVLIRRTSVEVATRSLWSPPPLVLIPEDIPVDERDNARWFHMMKSHAFTLGRHDDLDPRWQDALCRFLSRHAAALSRISAGAPAMPVNSVLEYAHARGRWLDRGSDPAKVRAAWERWHFELHHRQTLGSLELSLQQKGITRGCTLPAPRFDSRTLCTPELELIPITTVGAVFDEARDMEHCIASHVVTAVAGNSLLFRGVVHGERVTVELARSGSGRVLGPWTVRDFRRRHNHPAGAAASAAIRVWATRAVAVQQVAEHAASPSQQR